MSLFSPIRRISPLLFGALLSSCQLASAPGTAAQIQFVELTVFEAAGGQVSQSDIRLDFTTGLYTVGRCASSMSSLCLSSAAPRQEVLSAADRDRFNQLIRSSSFRRLRASYDVSGERPPDGASSRLVITTDAGEQTVSWDRGASYPAILADVECRLLQLTGWLILCA